MSRLSRIEHLLMATAVFVLIATIIRVFLWGWNTAFWGFVIASLFLALYALKGIKSDKIR